MNPTTQTQVERKLPLVTQLGTAGLILIIVWLGLRYLAKSPVQPVSPPALHLRTTLKGGGSNDSFWTAFSPDGKTLSGSGFRKATRLWDVASGKNIMNLEEPEYGANYATFSPDGKVLAVSNRLEQAVHFWDVARGTIASTLQKGEDSNFGPGSLAYSPDGKTLAVVNGRDVLLWDVASKKDVATLKEHTGLIFSIAFSPDGKVLASGGDNKTIELWDVGSAKHIAALKGHTAWVYSVAFSPDGKTLASANGDKTIKLWDVASGKETATLMGHEVPVLSVAISPDGKTLASGDEYGWIGIWDIASGKNIFLFQGHTDGWDEQVAVMPVQNAVWRLSFSPDGEILASGSADRTIKLWDAPFVKATDK